MRPIDDMLKAAQGKTRFHMPGHKGRLEAVSAALDMTELPDTDDLYAPFSGIAEAERLLARSAGAGASILVPCGSTAGILAMVLAYVRPGGRLLMRRDAHHSAQSACILADVEPVLLPPGTDMAAAAKEIPCDAVLVTRPTFHGLVEPLPRADVPVLVDAAHGAHFSWWERPESALRAGADCAVESAHKTLGAYTGGAWLHLRRAGDEPRLRRMLRMVSTSSPSFLILRSLDEARAFMDEHGREALARLTNWCEDARGKLAAMGFPCPSLGDPTRLYIRTDAKGLTGWKALSQLNELGVDMEMADARGVVAICTVYDRPEDFAALTSAFVRLRPGRGKAPSFPEPAYGVRALRPRAAALGKTRLVPLKEAAGEIAARAVGAYPPGCATAAPGERLTEACVEFLLASRAAGATLFGAEGGLVEVVDANEGANGDV